MRPRRNWTPCWAGPYNGTVPVKTVPLNFHLDFSGLCYLLLAVRQRFQRLAQFGQYFGKILHRQLRPCYEVGYLATLAQRSGAERFERRVYVVRFYGRLRLA